MRQGLEQLQRVQGEVVDSLRELHRIKKRYHQLSHIASVAREKAADAQTRSMCVCVCVCVCVCLVYRIFGKMYVSQTFMLKRSLEIQRSL